MLVAAFIVALGLQQPPAQLDEASRKRAAENWEACVNVKEGDNYERAIAACDELTKGRAWDSLNGQNRAVIVAKRGVLRSRLRQWDRAGEDLDWALPRVSSDIRNWATVERGLVFNELKRYRDAMSDLNVVINNEQQTSDYYTRARIGRGIAYLLTGEYRRATGDFDWLVTNSKANAHVFYMRSLARSQLDDFAGADQDMAEAVRLDKGIDATMRGYGVKLPAPKRRPGR